MVVWAQAECCWATSVQKQLAHPDYNYLQEFLASQLDWLCVRCKAWETLLVRVHQFLIVETLLSHDLLTANQPLFVAAAHALEGSHALFHGHRRMLTMERLLGDCLPAPA